MRTIIVLSTLVLSVLAKPQFTPQYGAPSNALSSSRGSLGGGGQLSNNIAFGGGIGNRNALVGNSNNGGGGPIDTSGMPSGPKVYKHISVHIPPKDEFEEPQLRVVRPMMKPDKHVNIIFVKAPSASSSQQTEVILPERPESKTIVYLLVRKPSAQSDVKIRQPTPTRPPKPEVYFIKYAKGQGAAALSQLGGGGSLGPSGVAAAATATGGSGRPSTSPQYGVPSSG